MFRFILASAIVYNVYAKEYLVAENVCFSAVDTSGTFTSSLNGPVTGVRLEYVSGAVSCNKNSPPERCSHWGCGPLPEISLGTFITSSDHTVLAPNPNTVDFIQDDRYIDRWYSMENGDPNSDNLRFKAIDTPLFDTQDGTTYLIQYGEALGSLTANDNEGSTCANVYFEIEPIPEETCWNKHDEMGCQDRTEQPDASTVHECKEMCSTDPECKQITWYPKDDEHQDPYNGCFHSYSSCRKTTSNK